MIYVSNHLAFKLAFKNLKDLPLSLPLTDLQNIQCMFKRTRDLNILQVWQLVQNQKKRKTHPQAQDWTEAAAPSLCSPPGPSHTLLPHMTSQTYWPLKYRPQKNEVRGHLWDKTSPPKIPFTSTLLILQGENAFPIQPPPPIPLKPTMRSTV